MEGADVDTWDDDSIVKAFNFAMMNYKDDADEGTPRQSPPAEAPSLGHWEPVAQPGSPAASAVEAATRVTEGPVTEPHFAAAPKAQQYQPRWSAPGMMMPPTPPMPPIPVAPGGGGGDDEAFNDLLLAWYYSGYYTGRYQATTEFRRQQQQQQQQQHYGYHGQPHPPHHS